ncbi:MAG TPA: lipopolysaccharide assembly protein LapA domain-containing protein [Anaerolineales bacterium]|jgi:uncharacterized integral membrane protein
MQIFLILALLVAILAVIFAVQNIAVVSISFFAWHIQVSLAIALLVALGAGVLISLLVSIPGKVKGSLNSASHKKKFSNLEVEHESLKMKVDEVATDRDLYKNKFEASQKEISDLEDQLASLSAALQEAEQKLEMKTSLNTMDSRIVPPGEIASGPVGEKPGI